MLTGLSSPQKAQISRRAKLAPLGESGGTVQLEIGSTVKVALLIEMIVDGRMDGGEFL